MDEFPWRKTENESGMRKRPTRDGIKRGKRLGPVSDPRRSFLYGLVHRLQGAEGLCSS
jgi:hypothetical protein